MSIETLSESWFDSRALTSDDEPATPADVTALKRLLKGVVSPSVAANEIMTMSEDEAPLDSKLDRIAWLMFDVAMEYPAGQPIILDLEDAINALPNFNMSDEQKASFPKMAEWKRLDALGDAIGDMYRSYWANRNSPDGDMSLAERRRLWAAINAFLARRCIRHGTYHDLHRGLVAIRTALEEEPWNGQESQPSASQSSIYSLDAEVPAAAEWILIAGRLIYNYIDEERFSALASTTDLWKGKPRFSKERWAFWKSRLRWIEIQAKLADNTRSVAKKAADEMDEIERLPQELLWSGKVDKAHPLDSCACGACNKQRLQSGEEPKRK
ncbi:uncharacterized protein BP5553_09410 [Venustampulla echinocandica]|uniref:Uncharacterized protein n=1 Tax=Venustampulla echinocandica TaxID=2656787 RepID=A0A370TCN3_9HELO|nr:uncharacterized protein BP5553_09410 [Venustampulla echinocandica]RDL32008.1 hypothetical protein BP5553_09410 [Venustampulla echinocandica]